MEKIIRSITPLVAKKGLLPSFMASIWICLSSFCFSSSSFRFCAERIWFSCKTTGVSVCAGNSLFSAHHSLDQVLDFLSTPWICFLFELLLELFHLIFFHFVDKVIVLVEFLPQVNKFKNHFRQSRIEMECLTFSLNSPHIESKRGSFLKTFFT